MQDPQRSTRGGGCLIAAGLLLGPIVGVAVGQPALGVVAGGALGVVAALALWWRDRQS